MDSTWDLSPLVSDNRCLGVCPLLLIQSPPAVDSGSSTSSTVIHPHSTFKSLGSLVVLASTPAQPSHSLSVGSLLGTSFQVSPLQVAVPGVVLRGDAAWCQVCSRADRAEQGVHECDLPSCLLQLVRGLEQRCPQSQHPDRDLPPASPLPFWTQAGDD